MHGHEAELRDNTLGGDFTGYGDGVVPKTILGWVLLYAGGEPAGRALVSSLITPQIGEFSFVLTTTGVASGIFVSQEGDFLLAVIAVSLFVSPVWTTVLHYLVV